MKFQAGGMFDQNVWRRGAALTVLVGAVAFVSAGCGNPAASRDSAPLHDVRSGDTLVLPDAGQDCVFDASTRDEPYSGETLPDVDAGGVDTCVPSDGGILCADTDLVYFGSVLVGTAKTLSATFTNQSTHPVTVNSIVLDSSQFSLVDPPVTPFVVPSCGRFKLQVYFSGDGPTGIWYDKEIVVTYAVVDGDPQTISVPVRGTKVEASSVWCEMILMKLSGGILSLSAGNNATFTIANKGTGTCVASTVAIADCTLDEGGVVRCPSPEQAKPSPYFRLSFGPNLNGTVYIGGGSSWPARVYTTDSRPSDLPHYGMLYLIAKDQLTGKVSNYPAPVTLDDGTVNYDFLIRIVE